MLVIRLRRTGQKHQPTYRIVVADERKSVYGAYVDNIGTYNPKTKNIVLKKDIALEWMKKGAKPTNTVSKIFTKEGIDHKSISIKTYRAISKKELEKIKAEEEVEKAKEQAEKEAAKEAFEQQVEAEKAEQPSSEDKLHEAADEAIAEEKAEEEKEEKAEKQEVEKTEKGEEKSE